MKSRTVSVTEFKAKCLALLDEIAAQGGTITITKRGKPVAKVEPVCQESRPSLEGIWAGKVTFEEGAFDRDSSDLWECVRTKSVDAA
jgi:prevent-host-death family protein